MSISKLISRLRILKWKNDGAKIGNNFQLERNSFLDSSFPWLIEIGDDVTIAPDVLILSHDGGTKKVLGYSKVGKVTIGDHVFVGAKSIILPNTNIGSDCVIGAGSVVSGTIPPGSVVAGIPGRVVQSISDYTRKNQEKINSGVTFDITYTKTGKITDKKKAEMLKVLSGKNGFVV